MCVGSLLFSVAPAWSDEPPVPIQPDTVIQPEPDQPQNTGMTAPNRVLPGEPPVAKSYLIPALEIPLFIALLNRFDYYFIDPRHDYDVSLHSMKDHINHGPWVIDQDAFAVNQFGHPYQGAMYYGFARSANLNYWESWLYSNAGSLIWEIAGETTDPSINDQVASGTAGSFIGEALYRLSNLVLEGGQGHPGAWRHVAAGIISPPTELNRLVFGDRFGPVFENRDPAMMAELQLGIATNRRFKSTGSDAQADKTIPDANFHLSYGLPGKSGYRYQRPFDYFDIEVNTLIAHRKGFPSGMIRGLLFGAPYESGPAYRGVWGLYGTYDYLSPQVYRVSTTGASLGTTAQWWVARGIALQGTALAGVGFGSAGTIVLSDPTERDYHYGLTPQQLLNLRLIFGTRLMAEITGRNYTITEIGAKKAPGTESIQHANASLSVRLWDHQAITLGYQVAARSARFESATLPDRTQRTETGYVTYTLLGQPHFGAVEF